MYKQEAMNEIAPCEDKTHMDFDGKFKSVGILPDRKGASVVPQNKQLAIFIVGPWVRYQDSKDFNEVIDKALEKNEWAPDSSFYSIDVGIFRDISTTYQELNQLRLHLGNDPSVGLIDMDSKIISPAAEEAEKTYFDAFLNEGRNMVIPATLSNPKDYKRRLEQYQKLTKKGYKVTVITLNTDKVNIRALGSARQADIGQIYSEDGYSTSISNAVDFMNRIKGVDKQRTLVVVNNNNNAAIDTLRNSVPNSVCRGALPDMYFVPPTCGTVGAEPVEGSQEINDFVCKSNEPKTFDGTRVTACPVVIVSNEAGSSIGCGDGGQVIPHMGSSWCGPGQDPRTPCSDNFCLGSYSGDWACRRHDACPLAEYTSVLGLPVLACSCDKDLFDNRDKDTPMGSNIGALYGDLDVTTASASRACIAKKGTKPCIKWGGKQTDFINKLWQISKVTDDYEKEECDIWQVKDKYKLPFEKYVYKETPFNHDVDSNENWPECYKNPKNPDA
jgi:hypothetical protein